jgi:hypothetical protein
MTLSYDMQVPDDIHDDVGILLRNLQAIPTWTDAKHAIYAEFEKLVKSREYIFFTGDCRDYHLERKGQSCLYDVPLNQRGALAKFAGKRVRLVCGGSYNPYSDRFYFAKQVDASGIDLRHVMNYDILGSVVAWPVEVYLSGSVGQWGIDFEFVDPEARDSISYAADSADDFIWIAEERSLDLTEFIKALRLKPLKELQVLANDIEQATLNKSAV